MQGVCLPYIMASFPGIIFFCLNLHGYLVVVSPYSSSSFRILYTLPTNSSLPLPPFSRTLSHPSLSSLFPSYRSLSVPFPLSPYSSLFTLPLPSPLPSSSLPPSTSSLASSAPPPSWSSWEEWSGCSVSCNGGTRTRTRSCEGGASCRGNNIDTQRCSTVLCSGK